MDPVETLVEEVWPEWPNVLSSADVGRVCAAVNAAPRPTDAVAEACVLLILDIDANKSFEEAFVHCVHLMDALGLPRIQHAHNPSTRVGAWDMPERRARRRVAAICYGTLGLLLRKWEDADGDAGALEAAAMCKRMQDEMEEIAERRRLMRTARLLEGTAQCA